VNEESVAHWRLSRQKQNKKKHIILALKPIVLFVPVWCSITDLLYCVECVDGCERLIEIDVNDLDVASCEMLTQRLPRESEKYNVIY
jgi:hypothetical protein